jgi:hypothetical protein
VTCRVDTQSNHWFQCALGTVGCPHVHNGRTPHCIECAAGGPCRYQHDPPELEVGVEEYVATRPGMEYLLAGRAT